MAFFLKELILERKTSNKRGSFEIIDYNKSFNMINEADLNILVSNVVSENNFKHCRLCLRDIQDKFVQLQDCISIDNKEFQTLSDILRNLVGEEVMDEVSGVNAVCCECVEQIVTCAKFIDQCKRSTEILNKIFKNLSEALNVDIDVTDTNQQMYVIVGEKESKVILMDKNEQLNLDVAPLVTKKNAESDKTTNMTEEGEDEENEEEPGGGSDDDTPFCKKCQISFESPEELVIHYSERIHKEGLKCPYCTGHKNTEKLLKQHIDKCHTPYVCKDCGKTCVGLEKLYIHEEKHDKNECPKCGKVYLTKDFYTKHVELCISEQLVKHPYRGKSGKTHFCEKCGKGYSTTGGLRVHERFVHGNATPHVCELCGKKFTAPSYLKTHMIKHTGEKNFSCNICLKKFVSKEAVLYHTRRHTGEKPYSCNLCPERFVNASARAEHIKYKHSRPKLHCNICKRNFYTISFLRQHMKRHSDPSSKLYAVFNDDDSDDNSKSAGEPENNVQQNDVSENERPD